MLRFPFTLTSRPGVVFKVCMFSLFWKDPFFSAFVLFCFGFTFYVPVNNVSVMS